MVTEVTITTNVWPVDIMPYDRVKKKNLRVSRVKPNHEHKILLDADTDFTLHEVNLNELFKMDK